MAYENSVYEYNENGELCVRVIGAGGGGDQHNLGWYAMQSALETAHPTATDGDWAIVGSTDTVWVWDSDNNEWKDTDQKGQVESVNGKTGAVVLNASDVGAIPQVSTMPTATADNVGKIVQYVGETDANYTNGYFYKCVSDGQDPATYAWEAVEVQAGSGGSTTYIPIYKYADDIPVGDQSHDGDAFMWGGTELEWGYLHSGHFYKCNYIPGNGIKSGDVLKYYYVGMPPTPQIYFDYNKMSAYLTVQSLPALSGVKMSLFCIRDWYDDTLTALSATITYNIGTNSEGQFFINLQPENTVADLEQTLADIGLTIDLSAYNFDEPNSDGMNASFYLPTLTQGYMWEEIKVETNGYETMPDPYDFDPNYPNNIVQYVGETNGQFIEGYFYKTVNDPDTGEYVWQQVNVQPVPSGLPTQTGLADGNYRLRLTMTNGVPSLSWVAE